MDFSNTCTFIPLINPAEKNLSLCYSKPHCYCCSRKVNLSIMPFWTEVTRGIVWCSKRMQTLGVFLSVMVMLSALSFVSFVTNLHCFFCLLLVLISHLLFLNKCLSESLFQLAISDLDLFCFCKHFFGVISTMLYHSFNCLFWHIIKLMN